MTLPAMKDKMAINQVISKFKSFFFFFIPGKGKEAEPSLR